jgi:hypothetical protein
MSVSLLVLAVHLVMGSVAGAQPGRGGGRRDAHRHAARHEKWMAEHGRTYKDEAEKARRLEIFRANAELIDSFNAAGKNSHRRLATNRFADLTDEDYMFRFYTTAACSTGTATRSSTTPSPPSGTARRGTAPNTG